MNFGLYIIILDNLVVYCVKKVLFIIILKIIDRFWIVIESFINKCDKYQFVINI